MDKLIVDTATLERLAKLDHGVQICDPSGRAIGWFQPVGDTEHYEGFECPLSPEELDQIEREGGGRPLADILRDLERQA